jgi:hypothetical protein
MNIVWYKQEKIFDRGDQKILLSSIQTKGSQEPVIPLKITSKSFAQEFELKWSLGGPLSKLCVTPPFSINFRWQFENQVSDYRLLGAFSLNRR